MLSFTLNLIHYIWTIIVWYLIAQCLMTIKWSFIELKTVLYIDDFTHTLVIIYDIEGFKRVIFTAHAPSPSWRNQRTSQRDSFCMARALGYGYEWKVKTETTKVTRCDTCYNWTDRMTKQRAKSFSCFDLRVHSRTTSVVQGTGCQLCKNAKCCARISPLDNRGHRRSFRPLLPSRIYLQRVDSMLTDPTNVTSNSHNYNDMNLIIFIVWSELWDLSLAHTFFHSSARLRVYFYRYLSCGYSSWLTSVCLHNIVRSKFKRNEMCPLSVGQWTPIIPAMRNLTKIITAQTHIISTVQTINIYLWVCTTNPLLLLFGLSIIMFIKGLVWKFRCEYASSGIEVIEWVLVRFCNTGNFYER